MRILKNIKSSIFLWFMALFSFPLILQSQNSANKLNEVCLELQNSKVSSEHDVLVKDLFKLINCSNKIDSFDLIYMGPSFSQLVIEAINNNQNYGELLKNFENLKGEEYYQYTRNLLYSAHILKDKVALIETWEQDKELLIKLKIPNDFLEGYEEYMKKNADGIKTHGNLVQEYKTTINDDSGKN